MNKQQKQNFGKTTTHLLVLFLTVFSYSFTTKFFQQKNDFELKVDSFLKKYSTDFSLSNDRFSNNSNDFVLDNKTKSDLSKVVTLKCKTSFVNQYKQTVYQRLYLGFYQFNSQKDCNAALDSLLNCFGTDCQKIKRGENGQLVKTSPVFYLLNENQIIVCHIACEHKNEFWKTFTYDLKMNFGNEGSFTIYSDCGGPITFNKF